MKKYFCVISHTHWDREWYKPFQQFRMQLTDLINNLLNILNKDSEYIFHLDAQTVVLEDYLEIYPENEKELKEWIKKGNIIVGPWYLQNDFYLTSGESTIRNLIVGNKIANSFGECSDVGYAPDQFGNISQMPQILKNFDIDNFVFGRGYSCYHKDDSGEIIKDNMPSEFTWRGADGTEILAIHMKFWYNNAQRFSEDIVKAKKLVEYIEKQFNNVSLTPYLLLMNGVDHLEAQENLIPIINNLNSQNINGEIKQYKLSQYVNDVKKFVRDNNIKLSVHNGELRNGGDNEILQGTLSSRVYIKRLNVLAQNYLEHILEPLYSMLEIIGCKEIYPKNYFNYLWKKLMKNHPHDSICGCSRDEISLHMEDSYLQINEVCEKLLEKGLKIAADHNPVALPYPDSYSLIFINTLATVFSGVIEADLIFPVKDEVNGFNIFDEKDNIINFKIISRTKKSLDVFSPINLPGSVDVEHCKIYLELKNIKPFSFNGYSVRKSQNKSENLNYVVDYKPEIENSSIKISVNNNGQICIYDKSHNRKLENCLYFEDTGDRGDSYTYRPCTENPIYSKDNISKVEVIEKNDYVGKIKLSFKISIPKQYDFEKHLRSSEKTDIYISLIIKLVKDSNVIDISYEIKNTAFEHRLRLIVATDIISDKLYSDIPFDIVNYVDGQKHPDTISNVHPNTSFFALENDNKGLAVFTEGNHECEKTDRDHLALTLLRSTGVISRWYDSQDIGDQWKCPGNQCIRNISGRVGICLYNGDILNSDIPNLSLRYRNPILTSNSCCDIHKITGGRPAVQDSEISELFYRQDPYDGISFINNKSLIKVKGNNIKITALKKAENNNGYILRLYNYGLNEEKINVEFNGKKYITDMSENTLSLLSDDSIYISIASKKIISFRLV